MELSAAITMFKDLSGRRTLARTTIEEYLTAGLRFLDDKTFQEFSLGKHVTTIAAGKHFYAPSIGLRRVDRVSYVKDGKAVILTKQERGTLSFYKGDKETGAPEFYNTCSIRKAGLGIADGETYTLTAVDATTKMGLVFNTILDQTYQFIVEGKFYTELDDDNWWLDNYGLALVHAGLYKMELGYRNTEGANDWLKALMPVIEDVNNEKIEEDITTITKMEG